MKHQLKTIIPLSLALFVLVSYQFIAASSVWSPAPGTPPNPNADMPIHTGGNQIKNGGLSLTTLGVTNSASVGGNLNVNGTTNVGGDLGVSGNAYVGGLWSGNWVGGNYLRANTQVRSANYCTWGGGNCTNAGEIYNAVYNKKLELCLRVRWQNEDDEWKVQGDWVCGTENVVRSIKSGGGDNGKDLFVDVIEFKFNQTY